jgi:hypothetical protein
MGRGVEMAAPAPETNADRHNSGSAEKTNGSKSPVESESDSPMHEAKKDIKDDGNK